jgi:hypothetical protein
MIYYANPCTDEVRDAMSAGEIGCITTPYQGNVTFPDEWDVIADNGAFSQRWTPEHWWRWLLDQPRRFRFAVCPDTFDPTGGPCHLETLDKWRYWSGRMERAGFVPAFVCQVGCKPRTVPVDASVLFLGGTTEWKLGPDAWAITEAHAADRWVHMGRVNSKKRLDTARAMGCDSVDGTYLTFGPDTNLPRLLSWLDDAAREPMLLEAGLHPSRGTE